MKQMAQGNVSEYQQEAAKCVLGSAHMLPLKVAEVLFWQD